MGLISEVVGEGLLVGSNPEREGVRVSEVDGWRNGWADARQNGVMIGVVRGVV